MFSAQAVARSEDNRAAQIVASIGRIGLGMLTKGASTAAFAAKDAIKAVNKPKVDDGVII